MSADAFEVQGQPTNSSNINESQLESTDLIAAPTSSLIDFKENQDGNKDIDTSNNASTRADFNDLSKANSEHTFDIDDIDMKLKFPMYYRRLVLIQISCWNARIYQLTRLYLNAFDYSTVFHVQFRGIGIWRILKMLHKPYNTNRATD